MKRTIAMAKSRRNAEKAAMRGARLLGLSKTDQLLPMCLRSPAKNSLTNLCTYAQQFRPFSCWLFLSARLLSASLIFALGGYCVASHSSLILTADYRGASRAIFVSLLVLSSFGFLPYRPFRLMFALVFVFPFEQKVLIALIVNLLFSYRA